MLRLPEACLLLSFACLSQFALLAQAQAQQVGSASDGASDAAVEEARRLFAEGLGFVEREDWVQAEERFRRVLALRSSHVASYNLASALVHLERLVEAAELLRSILRAGDVDPATREAARQLLSDTEPRIGTLTVRVTGDTSATRFTLDGKPIELTAHVQTLAVDAGAHELNALRAGSVVAAQRVTVGGGEPLQVEVELALPALIAPAEAVQPPPPEPTPAPRPAVRTTLAYEPPEESTSSNVWLWVAGGGAVVAAAAAVTIALLLSGSEQAAPVAGDTDPAVIRGRVR